MNFLYPLKLSYVPVQMIWGGARLRNIFAKTEAPDKTGETWELSVRDKQMCKVENGDCAGMTVREYIKSAGNGVVSDNYAGDRFPLLIKFIDAADKLSVQVHPDNKYAAEVENDFGKTEMWYVIDADPGAQIIYGFADGCSKDDFRKAFEAGKLQSVLNYVNVKPGDVFFIPSGLLHAIGKGILIAEIQQNCDLTYRVYDYDRRDINGNLRELHVKKALDVVQPFTENEINSIRFANATASERTDDSLLAHCEYFRTKKLNINASSNSFNADKNSFHSLLCIGGKGEIICNGSRYEINAGDSWFIPADTGEYRLDGSMQLIQTTL